MKPIDFLILGIVVLILVLSVILIYRSKKSGKKCIGCPDSEKCASSGCCGCSQSREK